MSQLASRLIAAICCCAAIALSGCASVGVSGSGDAEGVNNAIATDNVGFVRSAIQSGTLTPNARVSTPGYPDGAPLLAVAARAASLEVMRYLISAGADLNARTPVGETPLMLASFFFDEAELATGRAFDRHEKAVRLLVGSGAELENLPHHYTALAYAAYQGNDRVVRFLLERGARVNADAAQGGTYVNTPLMMAAIQGHERVTRLLLQAGADADIRVFGGHTAAEFAAKYNHRGLAQMLLCAQRQYGSGAIGSHCRQLLGFDPTARPTAVNHASREP